MKMEQAASLWRAVADWEVDLFGHAKSRLSFPVDGSGVDRVELVMELGEYGSLPIEPIVNFASISKVEAVIEHGRLILR